MSTGTYIRRVRRPIEGTSYFSVERVRGSLKDQCLLYGSEAHWKINVSCTDPRLTERSMSLVRIRGSLNNVSCTYPRLTERSMSLVQIRGSLNNVSCTYPRLTEQCLLYVSEAHWKIDVTCTDPRLIESKVLETDSSSNLIVGCYNCHCFQDLD